ncbi:MULTISPECIES: hypothetical protein [unclassified Ochrobactrum]|uniref:hypothetical protein n=1 Tax=unclassified Ochrobactrum TaxID=239106 RepID=UPI0030AFE3A4
MVEDGCAYLMGQIHSLRNVLRSVSKKIDPTEKKYMISTLLNEIRNYEMQFEASTDDKFKEFIMGAIEENKRLLKVSS